MGQWRPNQKAGEWIIGVLLVIFALRSLIPAGFMPSAGEPFSLRICPDGFPTQLLDHLHGSHHGHALGDEHSSHDPAGGEHQHDPLGSSEHCVFAGAAGIGPSPYALALGAWLDASMTAAATDSLPAPFTHQRYYIPQPRGPPPLA
jgi:Protein of unknown function (DUF2946)